MTLPSRNCYQQELRCKADFLNSFKKTQIHCGTAENLIINVIIAVNSVKQLAEMRFLALNAMNAVKTITAQNS